jgi:hypothetical protein
MLLRDRETEVFVMVRASLISYRYLFLPLHKARQQTDMLHLSAHCSNKRSRPTSVIPREGSHVYFRLHSITRGADSKAMRYCGPSDWGISKLYLDNEKNKRQKLELQLSKLNL